MTVSEVYFENFGPDSHLYACDVCGAVTTYSFVDDDEDEDDFCVTCWLIQDTDPFRWRRIKDRYDSFKKQRNLK